MLLEKSGEITTERMKRWSYSPWSHKESDMTEQLTLSLFTFKKKIRKQR